jgi:hypothetical protein
MGDRRIAGHLPLGNLEVTGGMNQFAWDMVYPGAKRFDNLIMWGGGTYGPMAPPGEYRARLIVGSDSSEVEFTLLKDPRSESSDADLVEKFEFLIETRDKLSETHQCIIDIRSMRDELNALKKKADPETDKDLIDLVNKINKEMREIEEALYQTKNRSSQDPLNFPIRLNNKLAGLSGTVSMGNYKPTDQAYRVKEDLIGKIDEQLDKFYRIKEEDLVRLNEMALEAKIPAVKINH